MLQPDPQVRGVHPQGGRPDGGLQDDGPAGHRAEGARGPRRAGTSGGTLQLIDDIFLKNYHNIFS